MKLVEILAKELEDWPVDFDGESVLSITQDLDWVPYCWDDKGVLEFYNGAWRMKGSKPFDEVYIYIDLAEDYQTAIVTKEMWEAEKAKMNVQNTLVEAESFNPIYCRDRIKEIDSLVESLEEERVSLVQALKDEGFALVNTVRVSPKVSSVAPVGDMSDWRNWKVGDHLEVTSNLTAHGFGIGEVVKIGSLDEGGKGMTLYCLNDSDFWFADHNEVKFHSRPQQ